jgi:hypothetical protein
MSDPVFLQLRDQFIRLRENGSADEDTAETLEAQAARHFKAWVDQGRIPDWVPSFPQDVAFEDPRISRQKWSMMWSMIYRVLAERHPNQLPDRTVVTDHKPVECGALSQSTLHWPLRLEGDAALCQLLANEYTPAPRPCTAADFRAVQDVSGFIDVLDAHLRSLDDVQTKRSHNGHPADCPDARAGMHALYAAEAARRLGIDVPQPMPVVGTRISGEARWFEALEKNAGDLIRLGDSVAKAVMPFSLKVMGIDLDALSEPDRELIEKYLDCGWNLKEAEDAYQRAGGIKAPKETENQLFLKLNAARNALAETTEKLVGRAQDAGADDSTLHPFDEVRRLRTVDAFNSAEPFLRRVVERLAKGTGASQVRPISPIDKTVPAGALVELKPSHSADFTFVNWFGTEYRFRPGNQAEAIKHLWAEFENGGLGLSEQKIGELIG